MADDTTLNPGSGGDTIATDDIGGIKHQRVKVEHGVDGAAADASSVDPLPVIAGRDDVITREATVKDSDGLQTGVIIANPAAGQRINLLDIQAVASQRNAEDIEVRVAFSTTTTLPTAAVGGVNGVVLSADRLGPGGKLERGDGSARFARGAADEELRLTCGRPFNGDLRVVFSYYETT